MEYVGTNRNKGHLFQCPAGGCHLKDKVLATGFCKDQHYEKPKGKLLRIVGPAAPMLGSLQDRVQEAHGY